MKNSKKKSQLDNHTSIAAASSFDSSYSMKPPEMFETEMESESSAAPDTMEQEDIDSEIAGPSNENVATIKPGKLMAATEAGHQFFKSLSRFTNVAVHGVHAIGSPGCLVAPDIQSYIFSNLGSEIDSEYDLRMAQAVSKVMAKHLNIWKEGFNIPHQLWYPMFSYFPGPVAPPMLNLPTRLANSPSFGEYFLTNEQMIFQEIMSHLPSDMNNDINRNTVESFSTIASEYFDTWINTSYITNVMAMGNVPGFSPPFALGGPVHGHVITQPGALS